MTPAQLDTARALVRSPHWRWMRGMHVAPGSAVMVGEGGEVWQHDTAPSPDPTWGEPMVWVDPLSAGVVPIITDPATVGCLAHLARELWAPAPVYIRPSLDGRWYVVAPRSSGMGSHLAERQGYDTTGEAWAALILAAPEPAP
jgi:hypothetical protein